MAKRYEYERYLLQQTPSRRRFVIQAVLDEIREFRSRMYKKQPAILTYSTANLTDLKKALVLLANQALRKIIFLPIIDVRQGRIPKKNLPKYNVWEVDSAFQNALIEDLVTDINNLIQEKVPPQFSPGIERSLKLALETMSDDIFVDLFTEKVDTLLRQDFDKHRFYDWFEMHGSYLNQYDEIPQRLYEQLFNSLITLLQIFIYYAYQGDELKVAALRLLLKFYPTLQIWGYKYSPHNIGKRPLTWYAIV